MAHRMSVVADSSEDQATRRRRILHETPILLLDGGLGTTLEDRHAVKFGKDLPLWSSHLLVSSPDTLLDAQTAFAEAGADVLITATYQASMEGFRNTPQLTNLDEPGTLDHFAEECMLNAVSIAREAADVRGVGTGLVALSLGAYGAIMVPSQEYTGFYPPEMLADEALCRWHTSRLRVFTEDVTAWKNVDIVAFETLPRLSEVRAARMAMDAPTLRHTPYWISCVFSNEDERLPDGSSIAQVVEAMLSGSSPLPFAVGLNCTKVHKVSRLVKMFEDAAESLHVALPHLVIYPDGADGLKYDTSSQRWLGDSKKDSSWDVQVFDIIKEVRERGRWQGILVGGCCKTAPDHIARLRGRLYQIR